MSARNPNASDFVHDNARVGPIAAPASEIRLEGGNLLWRSLRSVDHSRQPYRELIPEHHMFRRFLRLDKATDEAILSFAKRNGVLGLCKHGLPICHGPRDPQDQILENGHVHCIFGFTRRRDFIESLESWRALSRAALALLTLRRMVEASDVRRGTDEIRNTWKDALWLCSQQADCSVPQPGYRSLVQTAERTRGSERIALVANEWLRCGGVALRLMVEKGGYQFNPVLPDFGPNLFGCIAFQLAANLTLGEGFAICPGCHEVFEPPNTISTQRRAFCPTCQAKGKPRNSAMTDYRARVRDARRMYQEGRSVPEIAEKLQRTRAQIKIWIRQKS
jgi:hypothetical protein